ncbi:hypothetical protein GDO86_002420 [Hymenochirus boettgeri]|uniref:ADP-ribosylation factor-like protein 15 n=1 Tax=Hymenochirus boettgeri TaxID=247094 RepID=A0A8T2KJ79_9PIPI|nr:hypothetical protein GDO86_002420 [Hymenochirus boettgeri]
MDYMCFRALCCKGPPPPRPEYDIVCIGLTGSGKTTLLTQLCSESQDNIVPTTGFNIKAVPFQTAILNVKELGGIKKYFELEPLARGKRWILQATSLENMDAVKDSFSKLINLLDEREPEPVQM